MAYKSRQYVALGRGNFIFALLLAPFQTYVSFNWVTIALNV